MEADQITQEANQRLLKKRATLNQTVNRGQKIEPIDYKSIGEKYVKQARELEGCCSCCGRQMPPQDKTANGCIYCCDNEEPLKVKTESWPGRYSGVPKLYGNCTFDNYQGNEKLITELRNEKNNLVLRGNTGCGKTHLAVAILNTAKIENVHHNSWRYTEKKFITVPDLLLRVRSAFKDNSNESEDEIIKEFTDIPLLVLDDLGAEKTSEFVVTTLYIILDRRIRDCRKTIITTNLSQAEIEETFGARIASRLSSMENIKINMPDWRKKR